MTVASTKQTVIDSSGLSTSSELSKLLEQNSELWKSFAQTFAYCYKSASRQVFTILAINYMNFSRSEIHQTRILGLFFFKQSLLLPSKLSVNSCDHLKCSQLLRSAVKHKSLPRPQNQTQNHQQFLQSRRKSSLAVNDQTCSTFHAARVCFKRCCSCTRGNQRTCSTARERSRRCQRRR